MCFLVECRPRCPGAPDCDRLSCVVWVQLLQQFTFEQDPGQDTEQRAHGPFIELLQFSATLFENAARPVHAASAAAKHLQLLFVIGDGRIDRGEHVQTINIG